MHSLRSNAGLQLLNLNSVTFDLERHFWTSVVTFTNNAFSLSTIHN